MIDTWDKLPLVIGKLSELGYRYNGDQGIKGREAFKRIDSSVPYTHLKSKKMTQYLYVCEKNEPELVRHLLFRKILRGNPGVRVVYSELKWKLGEKHRNNRVAYTDGKTEFIKKMMKEYGGENNE